MLEPVQRKCWVLSDVRRMNVALTRAKTTLWILGNKDSLSRNEVWKKLLTDAGERNCITQAYPGFLNPSNSNPGLKRKEENVFTPQQTKFAKSRRCRMNLKEMYTR